MSSTPAVVEAAKALIEDERVIQARKEDAIAELWAGRKAIDEALTAFGVDPDSRPRKPRADKGTKRSRKAKGGEPQTAPNIQG